MLRVHDNRRLAALAVGLFAAFVVVPLALSACEATNESTATAGSSGSGGGCPVNCSTIAATPHCELDTGECVECLDGTCGSGEFCDPDQRTCETGCAADVDCDGNTVCDSSTHQCVDCTDDSQCGPGELCSAEGTCLQGCSAGQPCPGGQTCCGDVCRDVLADALHCGACDNPCPDLANAVVACDTGQCILESCEDGFSNCNINTADGCEWDLTAQGDCSCDPGTTQPCYTGPIGTEKVGECAGGITTCKPDGTGFGECGGQATPTYDWCGDGVDQDCDGVSDNPPDLDADGWNDCQGDCCDSVVECGQPELVNPGAFELGGNMVDDDCDGTTDNALPQCDSGLASNSGMALDYAKAIDLCQTTTEDPANPIDRRWGVISAELTLADGTGTPHADAHSIRPGFGDVVVPLRGASLGVLSTGSAAALNAPNDTLPDYAAFQPGRNLSLDSPMPADWLAANGGAVPTAPGCPQPLAFPTTAFDPVMLTLRVRVPTNANSFSFSVNFHSAEYPEYVCSNFNDFFVVLLDSLFVPGPGQTANPADKNLAFYDSGSGLYPLGVNLAHGDTGLFKQCKNGETGCDGSITSTTTSCVDVNELTGTGFDLPGPDPPGPSKGRCGTNDLTGGATSWLNTTGNVVPGEIVTLRVALWDTQDRLYDTLTLIDHFRWSVDASTPGVSE
jgi:hypothetical protein